MSVDLQVLRAQAKRAAEKTCAGCNCTHRLSDCPQAVTILRGRTVLALIDAVEVLRFYAKESIWSYQPTDRGAEHLANEDRGQRARAALAAFEVPAS